MHLTRTCALHDGHTVTPNGADFNFLAHPASGAADSRRRQHVMSQNRPNAHKKLIFGKYN